MSKYDNVTDEELYSWLGTSFPEWLPTLIQELVNENKPHALADLKYTIKQEYKDNLHTRRRA